MGQTGIHVEAVRRIAEEIVGPAADGVDREGRFPHETVAALRTARMMSACVPQDLGGFGCGLVELSDMCEALAQHCSSAAMVFAMHHSQLACIVRHGLEQPYFRSYLATVVAQQNLIASVTSEVGVGGEMRTSLCGVERQGDRFTLVKDASTISYGQQADDLLVTARSSPDAPNSDQSLVLVRKADYSLEQKGAWDALGMRGTCSPPFKMTSRGGVDQILATPFSDIASQTMVPFSHILWASCWLGIAKAAMTRARAFVRAQARAKPGTTPHAALRLAKGASLLQSMRTNVEHAAHEFEALRGRVTRPRSCPPSPSL